MSPNRKRSRSFSAPAPCLAPPPDAHALFRARMRAGDYNALVGRHLRRSLREAASLPDLEAETGFLRLALIRLLQEEDDPSRLATGVARLGAVAVQIARLRQSTGSDRSDIDSTLARILAEIDAEAASAKASLHDEQSRQLIDKTPTLPRVDRLGADRENGPLPA